MPLEFSFSTDGQEFTSPELILPGAPLGIVGQEEMLIIRARLSNNGGDIFSVPPDLALEHPYDPDPLMQEEHQIDVVPENGEIVREFTTHNGRDTFVKVRHVAKVAIRPFHFVGPS